MTAYAASPHPETIVLRACTVSRDLPRFGDLIEAMELHLGEAWGDVDFRDAAAFLRDEQAKHLEFLILAVTNDDQSDLVPICALIKQAKAQSLPTIVVGENLNPAILHQLMRHGAVDFIPYPLPSNGFTATLERLRNPPPMPQAIDRRAPLAEANDWDFTPQNDRSGQLIAAHGLSGGTGSTTFCTNLAWEMALSEEGNGKRICLLDLDFQFGSVANSLDLLNEPNVFDLLTSPRKCDAQALVNALQCYGESLYVMTAPSEILPHDVISAADMARILDLCLANFDYVVVDLPCAITPWTSQVLLRAQHYFLLLTPEARAQHNLKRFIEALSAEDWPMQNLRKVLNRDPDFAITAPIERDFSLPDGGVAVTEANDHGEPLAEGLPKNPLRRELRRLAQSLAVPLAQAKRLH